MRTTVLFRLLYPIRRFVAGQLAQPRGWFGRVVMTRTLNRGNRELIAATIGAASASSDARFLDVGFGGGAGLRLARELGVQHLAGVDPSSAALDHVNRASGAWCKGAELVLKQGSVERLPFGDAAFDVVVSTNTLYFWRDLGLAFAQLWRVLALPGRLVLGFSGVEKLREFEHITNHGFCCHDLPEILAAARGAGFAETSLVELHGHDTEGDFLLIAEKRAADSAP